MLTVIKTSTVRKLLTIIYLVLHLSFILAIIFEKHYSPLVLITFILIMILMLVGYRYMDLEDPIIDLGHIRAIIFVVTGAVLTFYIDSELGFGPVVAASFVGLIGSLYKYVDRSDLYKEIPNAIYCGAFIGMSNIEHTDNIQFILIKSILAAILFFFSKDILTGFGGKLGTIAFAAVAFVIFLTYIFV